jgi:hypothetical protein
MSRNNMIIGALAGVAAAALVRNYLQTENGKQMLNTASETLKDLTAKATEFAKQNLSQVKGLNRTTDHVQPS